ncbi:glycoside hydrolase family 32 protein [Lacibacter luteus]|uniref:Glycoside hydrolase family 32 protein n=1 Tax=Lacibacter luteus TaxID=2508719 RepID=A0A4Q1CLQ2_9BACT|nr:glycoside hydrolase family 32 protein [Lacibacter luteus]RXK61635.1 glycoside hydrolase family 32 protein [Lacibacter luteus]
MKKNILMLCFSLLLVSAKSQQAVAEQHRPQLHFSPKEKWINDPNGLVYHKGVYHLFYQYYPNSTVWGPMHWGHATSKDLLTWQHQPVALYPDSLGYIFSGSAVVDVNNTAGFGKGAIVAIFTHHNPKGEQEKRIDFQNQSIAYSLDDGKTWSKYAGNPVLKNPGIVDFRDPKVMWFEKENKWVMTLATKDRITFYSSPDLKNWSKESEFGETLGAHGGVWECPDLFPLTLNGKQVWVLLVSINPGGPNGGSATQYFTGEFNGKTFTPFETETKWMDYGTDNYAGVTFSNTANRRILIGWMNNWQYAQAVPTKSWRGAMTIPRELYLKEVNKKIFLASKPVKEVDKLQVKSTTLSNINIKNSYNLSSKLNAKSSVFQLSLNEIAANDFSIVLSNKKGEELVIGYDKTSNQYYIDRSKSGAVDFEKGFAKKHVAPRISTNKNISLRIIVDVASVELFADDGLTVMTDVFFPAEPYSSISIRSVKGVTLNSIQYMPLKSTMK